MKFLRQQANYKKRIPLNWRKPKGHHSKLREKRRGLHKMPGIAYKKPVQKKVIIVSNLDELKAFKKGDKVFIKSSVGNKKRVLMLEYAVKHGIIINNYGSKISDKLKSIKEAFVNRLKSKKVKVIKPVKVEEPKKKKVVVKKAASTKKKVVVKGDNK